MVAGSLVTLLGMAAVKSTTVMDARATTSLSGAEATVALRRLMGYVVVSVRAGVAGISAIAALISMSPPAGPVWVVPAVIVNCVWAAAYFAAVLRQELRPWSTIVDVLFSATFAVFQRYLVGPGALPDGGSWVATLCSITLIMAILAWRLPAAVVAGAFIAAGYTFGAGIAGTPDHAVPQLVAFSVQVVVTSVLMAVLRRVSRFADGAITTYHHARREAQIREAVRAAEREQNRIVHDKVLGVLTPVGKGDIRQTSATLRDGAAIALDVIAGLDGQETQDETAVRLDHLLLKIANGADHRLVPATVPRKVAVAFAGAAEAALDNVARHARSTQAQVVLTRSARQILVEVSDDGCGFDPQGVPAHRYGLREAIRGRMTTVGGGAVVESAPGAGTRVRMWWRSDG